MLVPGSFAKCGPCGTTLRTVLDWQLHRCHPMMKSRRAARDHESFYAARLSETALFSGW
jgi:hypothetical protein